MAEKNLSVDDGFRFGFGFGAGLTLWLFIWLLVVGFVASQCFKAGIRF